MMTEDEAKTKWCPMARSVRAEKHGLDWHPTGPAFNQGRFLGKPSFPVTRCIGSACMMWRWDGQYVDEDRNPAKAGVDYTDRGLSELGYCGLAGEPK